MRPGPPQSRLRSGRQTRSVQDSSGRFRGLLPITDVLRGLSSAEQEYLNFGRKLDSNEWTSFPKIVTTADAFKTTPTIEQVYSMLSPVVPALPVLDVNDRLVGIVDFRTIAQALYSQAN